MYTIVGASGSIGAILAERLLKEGKRVRVISRSREQLALLIAKGAEPVVIHSLLDKASMTDAFRGATGIYTMVPPVSAGISYGEAGMVMAEAASDAGVSHVVNVSAMGAHLPDRGAYRAEYFELESAFNRVKTLNVFHLRPGLFMKSFFSWIPQIKRSGVVRGLFRGDLAVPRVASRDIAAFAFEALVKQKFQGSNVQELHGQRDISMNEAAEIIGKVIGKQSIRYVQMSTGEFIDDAVAKGASAGAAKIMSELYLGWNDGSIRPFEPRSNRNTTPTMLEAFVLEEFVPLYNELA